MTILTDQHGEELLKLARSTIADRLGKNVVFPEMSEAIYDEMRGTFVTLKKDGELRGCIGNIEPVITLTEGIRKNSLGSAFHDQRFSPLTPEELENINISLSILTKAEPLEYEDADDLCAKLRPGIDGVILRYHNSASTFLPQVWEQLDTSESFLSNLCLKAGLPRDFWRSGEVEVAVYQVQSFSEE